MLEDEEVMNMLGLGLENIAMLRPGRTRSITAENPTGEKGGGCWAELQPMFDGTPNPARELGKQWKGRPFVSLEPGSTYTVAEIEGPGVIQHIWITMRQKCYRSCVLRIYWDGEEQPSVEAPLGDFFCCGHQVRCQINSLPISVNQVGGFNSYWPMPFRKSARITIENQGEDWARTFFYQVDYCLQDVPEEAAYFHAQWRRSLTTREHPEHTIVDGIQGRGHYVGTYLAWAQLSNGWWGEGEVKFFLDGDDDLHPTICGTGTEDYVGGAWCFSEADQAEQPYSGPWMGCPLVQHKAVEVPIYGMYRWHVPDPIIFEKELKATVQALGWWPGHRYEPRRDDIATVAYWYQVEPHAVFPALPRLEERWPL